MVWARLQIVSDSSFEFIFVTRVSNACMRMRHAGSTGAEVAGINSSRPGNLALLGYIRGQGLRRSGQLPRPASARVHAAHPPQSKSVRVRILMHALGCKKKAPAPIEWIGLTERPRRRQAASGAFSAGATVVPLQERWRWIRR